MSSVLTYILFCIKKKVFFSFIVLGLNFMNFRKRTFNWKKISQIRNYTPSFSRYNVNIPDARVISLYDFFLKKINFKKLENIFFVIIFDSFCVNASFPLGDQLSIFKYMYVIIRSYLNPCIFYNENYRKVKNRKQGFYILFNDVWWPSGQNNWSVCHNWSVSSGFNDSLLTNWMSQKDVVFN